MTQKYIVETKETPEQQYVHSYYFDTLDEASSFAKTCEEMGREVKVLANYTFEVILWR